MNEKPNTTAGGDVARPAGTTGESLLAEAKSAVGNMAEGARDQVFTQVEAQKEKAAEKIGTVADALRAAGEPLADLGPLPDLAGRAADQMESIAEYVQSRTVGDIVREVERFARREPAIFLGAAFGIGLLAGRFLKSSPRREPHPEIQDGVFEEEMSFGTQDRGSYASSGLSSSGLTRSGVGRFETSRREPGITTERPSTTTWDRPVERTTPGVDRTMNSGFGGYGGSFATGNTTPYDTAGSSVSAKPASDLSSSAPITPTTSTTPSKAPIADSAFTTDKPSTTSAPTSVKSAQGAASNGSARSTGR